MSGIGKGVGGLLGPKGWPGTEQPQGATALVQAGETSLKQIAARLGVSEEALRRFNPQLADAGTIRPGLLIRLPSEISAGAAETSGGESLGEAGLARGGGAKASEQLLSAQELKMKLQSGEIKRSEVPPCSLRGEVPEGYQGIDLKAWLAGSSQSASLTPAAPAAPKGEGSVWGADIPPYDPLLGGRITNDMWTEEMLTAPAVPNDLVKNMVDPAAFLNARLARLQQPTTAQVLNPYGGSEPINASWLSSPGQAEEIRKILQGLGIQGEVQEKPPEMYRFGIDYGTETRRYWDVAGFNVGLLLERYSRYPKDVADKMTMEELTQRG